LWLDNYRDLPTIKRGTKMKIILQREGRLNLLVSLFLLSMTDPLHAQWVQTNGPYAGTVTCFAVSGTNIFADTERGVWKTELGSEAIHVTMLSRILSIISRIWWLVLKVASFFGIVLLIIVMAYTIIAGVVLLIVLIISAIYEVAITPIYEVITGKERTARYEYWVYERETGEIRAVKRGWSWPAFFFSWIWAFTKGLIAIGAGVIVYLIILGVIFSSDRDTGDALGTIVVALLACNVWLGAKGNKFVEDNLTKKGFKFAGTVNAATAKGAVASFLSSHSEEYRSQRKAEEDFKQSQSYNAPSDEDLEKAKRYGKVLGLHGKVTIDDIKQNYRDLIAKYHPDKVQHLGEELQRVAEAKTKEINEAYEYFKKKYSFD
jgi:hypothetical protein